MGWTDSQAWQRMVSGEACLMCADAHLDVNPFSFLVAELERSYLRLARNQWCPGWSVVLLKRHANELFELSKDELSGFSRDVSNAARALHAVYQPVKINYAVLGNLSPHVHCHLVPRFSTDDPHKPLDMAEREVLLANPEYERIIGQLRTELARTHEKIAN